jgi:ADP-ribose pyrophosphatase YjhB (NUDIX family)
LKAETMSKFIENTDGYGYDIERSMYWKPPVNSFVPQHCVQIFAVDYCENFLFIHRSPKVRSAANCWSTPTGLHDIGFTAQDIVINEMMEEWNLKVTEPPLCIGQYENIAGDPMDISAPHTTPQFHWVMSVYVAICNDLYDYTNNEPDKHDEVAIVPLSEVPKFLDLHKKEMHPTLFAYMKKEYIGYKKLICDYLEEPAF